MQVYRLGPNLDRKVYRYPGGSGLVGSQMLLEIEEQNGPRVLKYQFVATAEAPQGDTSEDKKHQTPTQVNAATETFEPSVSAVTVE
jgi:hypothetical protein